MSLNLRLAGIDQDALNDAIQAHIPSTIVDAEIVGKNEYCKTVNVIVECEKEIIVRILNSSIPQWVMESEAATLKYIAGKTSIPVPRILHINFDSKHALGAYMLLEKVSGVKLSTIFSDLKPERQDALVTQIAQWTMELFKHRFDSIGSLYTSEDLGFQIGPICRPSFYVTDRGKLYLERGPFKTVREYFLACAQRELDCARTQFAQDTSDTYQQDVEEARFTVERSMELLVKAINGCKGLDDDEPETNKFSLSFMDLDLTKIYVSQQDPTKIVSLPFWYNASTRPLWHCASLPSWLSASLSGEGKFDKERLEGTFRKVIEEIEGPDGLFLRNLDIEDTRRAIDEVCEYDAFRDGFILLPTLESMIATLPGEEDVAGLQALLDPHTLEGRAARIALLTKGLGPLSLAVEGSLSLKANKTALGDRPIIPRMGSGGLLMV